MEAKRYRVYEPDTPSDLALEFVQVWSSDQPIVTGAEFARDDGETWIVSRVEADPDPTFAGRVFFERR